MKELDELLKKAKSLPWTDAGYYVYNATDGLARTIFESNAESRYILIAANHLPKLVEALEATMTCADDCPCTAWAKGEQALAALRAALMNMNKEA